MRAAEITFIILLVGGSLLFAGALSLSLTGAIDCKHDLECSKNSELINNLGFNMLYAGGGCMLFSMLCTWIDNSNKQNKISKCDHNGKLIRGVTSWPKEEPGIFKTKITCLKCNCNGYIETNTEKNTQRIIWDEEK